MAKNVIRFGSIASRPVAVSASLLRSKAAERFLFLKTADISVRHMGEGAWRGSRPTLDVRGAG